MPDVLKSSERPMATDVTFVDVPNFKAFAVVGPDADFNVIREVEKVARGVEVVRVNVRNGIEVGVRVD